LKPLIAFAAAALAACATPPTTFPPPPPLEPVPHVDLRTPADFPEGTARSQLLFLEAAKVLTHPRCVNCHPAGDSPSQRMPGKAHQPPVTRGPDGRGDPTLACATCHQMQNVEEGRVPGGPDWHLAPRVMAWQSLTPSAICAQLKDPKRNGNRTLAQIVEHGRDDRLVGWGWAPGGDRIPAPGTQEQFGALLAAWVDSGAACPP
jgi:hypothetical protein